MTSEKGLSPPRAIKKGDFARKHEYDRPRFVDRLEYDARRQIEVAIVVDTVNDIWEAIPLDELILAEW
jgi:hypothetical protein